MTHIDFRRIIRAHIKTTTSPNTGKVEIREYFTFYFLPILATIAMIAIGFDINAETIETVVASLSVFIGLLFNALVLLVSSYEKLNPVGNLKAIIKETAVNILYSMIIALWGIFFALLGFVNFSNAWIVKGIDFVAILFIFHFVVIFVMVLVRLFNVFIRPN